MMTEEGIAILIMTRLLVEVSDLMSQESQIGKSWCIANTHCDSLLLMEVRAGSAVVATWSRLRLM